jgi:hypothetical protein
MVSHGQGGARRPLSVNTFLIAAAVADEACAVWARRLLTGRLGLFSTGELSLGISPLDDVAVNQRFHPVT